MVFMKKKSSSLRKPSTSPTHKGLIMFKRFYSQSITKNLFQLFPKTTKSKPHFQIDLKSLRKEYRTLQQQLHPDINHQTNDSQSSLLNKAYSTLKSSLLRSQHILQLNGIDLTKDDISQKYSLQDKQLLFEILDIHETLENITDEMELESIKLENDERIAKSEELLDSLFQNNQFDKAAVETIRLKYWYNINNAIKNWAPDKPIQLTH